MLCRLLTVLPTGDDAPALARTLRSVAAQTVRPERILLLEGQSQSAAATVLPDYPALPCEVLKQAVTLRGFGAWNAGLPFAEATEYLHLLRAGDALKPAFYERLIGALEACRGLGMAFCREEQFDEAGRRLATPRPWAWGPRTQFTPEGYLRRQLRFAPQFFSGTLLKPCGQRLPAHFRGDLSMMGKMAFWAVVARRSERIVRVNEYLCERHWTPAGPQGVLLPGLQALVYDEWRVLQTVDHHQHGRTGWLRGLRLRWILAARAALKCRRAGQLGKPDHAGQIARATRKLTGATVFLAARAIVELRELALYTLRGRRPYPRDLYR